MTRRREGSSILTREKRKRREKWQGIERGGRREEKKDRGGG